MKSFSTALILVIAILLLVGCENADKTDAKNPVINTTADAIQNAVETTKPALYSTDTIKIEDMDFDGVKFGDARQDVIDKLGQPESISELYGDYTYKNYTLAFTEQDSMCEVRILNKNYSIYKGIKLGDNIVSTLKLLPVPTTPSGMEVLYGNFNGNYENDFSFLEDYLIKNIKDPEMPNELNRYYRVVEFSFQKYVLKIEYMASGMEENAYEDFDAGQINRVWIETEDAPAFED